jgi:hypothetical protein
VPTDALTAAADDLYALVPEEFTAARNARAKAAKAEDRGLAQRIGELRKPSPAAWIVNQMVREQPDGIDELLDLGSDLREAQSAGDGRALTGIGAERRKLVSGLLQEATRIADAAGRPPSRAVLDEVEQSLIAATVDERAGEAVATGRLVRGIQAVGFEDVDLDGAVAGEASAARPKQRATTRRGRAAAERDTGAKRGSKHDEGESDAAAEAERRRVDAARAAERERADADVQEARDRAEQAQRELDEAQDLLHAAEWHADELRDERHDLETRLKELRSEIADAERGEREAERVRARAATAADRGRDDVEAAEAARDALD